MKIPVSDLSGFVLIGGQSRRMGMPKHELSLEGVSFLNRMHALGFQFSSSVAVIGKPHQILATTMNFFQDVRDLQTPLVGLETGIKHSTTAWNLFLACDYPWMKKNILEVLLSRGRKTADALIPVFCDEVHPLIGFYQSRILGRLNSFLDKGQRKVKSFLEAIDVDYVDLSSDFLLDELKLCFRNVNLPQERVAYDFI